VSCRLGSRDPSFSHLPPAERPTLACSRPTFDSLAKAFRSRSQRRRSVVAMAVFHLLRIPPIKTMGRF